MNPILCMELKIVNLHIYPTRFQLHRNDIAHKHCLWQISQLVQKWKSFDEIWQPTWKSFFLGTKCLEIEIVGPGVEKRFSILGHKANQKPLDGSKFCKSWHHHSVEYQGFCNKQTNEWILSNNTSGVPSKSYFWTTHRSTS